MQFSYTIEKRADADAFIAACERLEKTFCGIEKEKTLVDVDGSTFQRYSLDGKSIEVADDYYIDAVYVDSEVDLSALFNERVENE